MPPSSTPSAPKPGSLSDAAVSTRVEASASMAKRCAARWTWLASALVLTGCAHAPEGSQAPAGADATRTLAGIAAAAPTMPEPDGPRIDSAKLAAEGIKYLQDGDVERGLKLFNAALKFAPTVPAYHLLAGLAYHLQFLAGGSDVARDSAEIGYQLAAQYGPGEPLPWVQLGRLRADAGQYESAGKEYARAVELQPGNPDALYGLATSSYLSGDIKTALWSADLLADQRWNPAAVNRLRTLLFAAVGQPEQAARYRQAYAAQIPNDAPGLQAFDRRLREVESLLPNQRWLQPRTGGGSTSSAAAMKPMSLKASGDAVLLAQAGPAAVGTDPLRQAQQDAPRAAATAVPLRPALPPGNPRRAWFLCQPAPSFGAPMMGTGVSAGAMMGGQSGGEETSQLPALPAPCEGEGPPRTVMIDAVLLRTEDQVSRSYGLNLLQGLTGYFGAVATSVSGSSFGVQPLQRTNFFGLGGQGSGSSSAAALSYSLNIANATTNRNEVLARPTLLAIDRLPSTFFSGSTVSIAVVGPTGGSGQLVDKQIGTSFSVTPTFIDDDTVLLAVKAVRSFVEPPAAGTTGVSLSTSRNAVNSNLVVKYGQTVIISGLTERQLIRGEAGVPVLQDIPGIQYMFSSKSNTDFFRTVVVMITPRRPVRNEEDIAAVAAEKKRRDETGVSQNKQYAFYWRIDEYAKTLQKYAPNLDSAIDTLETNVLFKTFKGTDLVDTNWSTMSRLKVILHDIGGLLFH